VALGIGIAYLTQATCNLVSGPDLVYKHRHLGNPAEHGQLRIDVRGANFNGHNFIGGAETPKNVEQMVHEALDDFNQWNIYEQIGITSNQPVRAVKIEIKK
jgi:hypothetical protein